MAFANEERQGVVDILTTLENKMKEAFDGLYAIVNTRNTAHLTLNGEKVRQLEAMAADKVET